MKAAVLIEQNKPLKLQCFRKPTPIGYQVLIRIHCSGVCGAQLNEILGVKGPDLYLPHLMGHEGSGIVEEVGDLVKKVAPGDRVVLHWRKGSGGEGPFPRYEVINGEIGESVGGGYVTTFANLALIAENRITKIDNDIPFEIACLFGCGISTGYGIVINELRLKPGAALLVIGCGGVGLNVVHAASLMSAGQIIAVDRHAGPKEDLARKLGATDYFTLDSSGNFNELLRSICGVGFDAVVDTTGDTKLMQQGFRALGKNGTLILVGQPRIGEVFNINPALDLFTGKKIIVSEGGGFNPDTDMPKLQSLYRENPEAMRSVVTDRYMLSDVNNAIMALKSGSSGRIILNTQ